MRWISLGLMPGWNTSTRSPHDLNRLGSYLGLMTQANTDEPAEPAPPPTGPPLRPAPPSPAARPLPPPAA